MAHTTEQATRNADVNSGLPIFRLPDELLQLIVLYLPPDATINFGDLSKRSNKITYEPLVWRRHCDQTWRHWEERHKIFEKRENPPAQTKWQHLYNERVRIDGEASELFDRLLETQQLRYERMEKISKYGYDVKDLMLRIRDHTPHDAKDVLCRRYYASAILGQIHRATALEKWQRLQKRQMVRLEEVLGAYDLFVLNEGPDLRDVDRKLDDLADRIHEQDENFDTLSIRTKAQKVARYLRTAGLVGNPIQEDYHALRNNFISMALFDEPHTSLPLQSVAIYCAVARRLGINAKASNYPQHVHAVIEAPSDMTLDGKHKMPIQGADPELMHMDPWRTDEEIPTEHLRLRLLQMGAPQHNHMYHLGATSTLELALRTGRNIMTSVQEARERQRGGPSRNRGPDVDAAWYSMLWSMLVLGDASSSQASALHRRRQCLPYLIEHFQAHFPEDLNLVEQHIPPMFDGEREHNVLMHAIVTRRKADQNKKAPNLRPKDNDIVRYRIGQRFRHKRYGYEGAITGWDARCTAEQRWMDQMRVDDLPRGREQPFYHAMYGTTTPPHRNVYYEALCLYPADTVSSADDKSIRYVAEENIEITKPEDQPGDDLLRLAGRYFKRWDKERNAFVSNIKDEYPDD